MPGAELRKYRKSRTVTCRVCTKKFEAVDVKAMYCSNACRQKAAYRRHRKIDLDISCERCGAPMITDDRRVKYCSNECRIMGRLFKCLP